MQSTTVRALNPFTRFMATGAFSGYAPVAPGTVASFICAILAWFLLPDLTTRSTALAVLSMLLSLVAFAALAIWAAGAAEREYGKDASAIVIDEFAGYLIAVAFLPKSVFVYGAAFLLFRLVDIIKPFPAGRAESLPGGLGIVMDDVVAGIYANVLIRIMLLVKGW
jgi:phosphatidylglycerophosphatase A